MNIFFAWHLSTEIFQGKDFFTKLVLNDKN